MVSLPFLQTKKDHTVLSSNIVIDNKLVSHAEWKKYAWKIKRDGDVEILRFDNYEIACAYDDCVIRPKS